MARKKSKNRRRSNKPRGTGTEPRQPSPPSTTPNLATAGDTGATLTAATTMPTPRIGSNGRPMTYVSNTVSGACAPFSLSAAEALEKNPLPWVVAYRKGD
eukprot:CAMPEP_0194076190 /NCGR_PEP_ID=MMETSP0149-20130528/3038_1 /TAXON_ID=122233 /ORGANISM="Chaetoceros debilis, Strain MM31A-1" /LENGTH=99 /DNA_ID=CAMNT_0038756867 /DNA_START=161 /DNA_END=457 /DNA_ORIENTATION=+